MLKLVLLAAVAACVAQGFGDFFKPLNQPVQALQDFFNQPNQQPAPVTQPPLASPDLPQGFPDLTQRLPDLPQGFPDLTQRLPDLPQGFPDLTQRLPDLSQGIPFIPPGYNFGVGSGSHGGKSGKKRGGKSGKKHGGKSGKKHGGKSGKKHGGKSGKRHGGRSGKHKKGSGGHSGQIGQIPGFDIPIPTNFLNPFAS
ncbi:hypothetical protein SNE40_016820 [Patella caerulea]|uniref:Uncharacterized protein n=1 Tax=Patella caerulea TaxID=87958 RepID=A0AAN8PK83_PATCE